MKNLIKVIGGIFFLPFWYLERFFPRDNKIWLFGSWFGKKYSDNSRAMYEYVIANEPDIKPMWITYSRIVYSSLKSRGLPVAFGYSVRGIFYCLKAGIVFITTSTMEMNAKFLNGSKMIWLWHGVGIKHILADELKDKWKGYSEFKKFKVRLNRILFPYEQFADKSAVINTASFFTKFFCSAFEVEDSKIWVEGYPRNDALFEVDYHENLYIKYRKKFPSAKFIIYMPTHRINALEGRAFSGFSGFGFDAEKFCRVLEEEDYVFFNKGHFFDEDARNDIRSPRFLNISDIDYDNLYSFVKDMDILITDFSSIYFDFLLTGKPIIMAPFDYESYAKDERNLQFDYNEHRAVKAYDWNELLDILVKRSYKCPEKEEIMKFHKYIDNHSAERIARRVKENLI